MGAATDPMAQGEWNAAGTWSDSEATGLFALPNELKLLRDTVADFVRREILPLEADTPEGGDLPPELRSRLEAGMKELGLWAPDIPEEEGGTGLGELATILAVEQIAYSVLVPFRARSIFNDAEPILLRHCEGEHRSRYYEPVLAGTKRVSFALTEPNAGSDAAAIQTRAIRDGDEWVLNGRKTFISNALSADFFQVMAVTDPEKRGRGGITCFLVDRDTPGLEVHPIELMIGERPCELVFDNCRIPADRVLGELGNGFGLAQEWLNRNRLRHSAKCLGRGQRALDMAMAYARERVTFGKPLAERQAIQWMIADSVLELHSARLMLYHCAAKLDRGEEIRAESPLVKVACNEAGYRAADRAVQIFGGMGVTRELPVERIFRELRTTRITEGTTEIHRIRISRHALVENLMPSI